MEVKLINSIAEIDAGCLNGLVGKSYPFLRHEFFLALEQSGSVGEYSGWTPQHLLVLSKDQLVGFMPLYLKQHSRGEYVFDEQWSTAYQQHGLAYYPKWVTSIPFTPCQGQRIIVNDNQDEQQVTAQLFDFLKQNADQFAVSSWHCLFPIKQQAERLASLGLAIRKGVQFHWTNQGYGDFQDFLESFNSRNRKKIKRERRRAQEQGIEILRIPGPEITDDQWQIFFLFYQLTYIKRGMQAYLNIEFFEQLARTMPEQLLLVLAVKNNRYVAAALCFVGDDTLYGRYWGCYEEFNSLHFEVCYYQGLDYCIEKGLQRFDSGAQGEHKISRGFVPVTTYSAHWIKHPDFSRAIADFLRREQAVIQRYQQSATACLPFKKT